MKRLFIGKIKYIDYSYCWFEVKRIQLSIIRISQYIPKMSCKFLLPLLVWCHELTGWHLHSHCFHRLRVKGILAESFANVGLSNTWVSNKNNFDLVLLLIRGAHMTDILKLVIQILWLISFANYQSKFDQNLIAIDQS